MPEPRVVAGQGHLVVAEADASGGIPELAFDPRLSVQAIGVVAPQDEGPRRAVCLQAAERGIHRFLRGR